MRSGAPAAHDVSLTQGLIGHEEIKAYAGHLPETMDVETAPEKMLCQIVLFLANWGSVS